MIGTHLGPYEIIAPIGAGGMGAPCGQNLVVYFPLQPFGS